jgi:4'-phosphopantetheinyl transferase EntD
MLRMPTAPLLEGEEHESLCHQGIILGSITHCKYYCTAAVTRGESYRSIGIDVEPNERSEPGLPSMIARDLEREWISQAPD